VRTINYQGANHAFHNDTSAERYDAQGRSPRWQETLGFFKQHLS
jgi:carboxymethylenebutenolidase